MINLLIERANHELIRVFGMRLVSLPKADLHIGDKDQLAAKGKLPKLVQGESSKANASYLLVGADATSNRRTMSVPKKRKYLFMLILFAVIRTSPRRLLTQEELLKKLSQVDKNIANENECHSVLKIKFGDWLGVLCKQRYVVNFCIRYLVRIKVSDEESKPSQNNALNSYGLGERSLLEFPDESVRTFIKKMISISAGGDQISQDVSVRIDKLFEGGRPGEVSDECSLLLSSCWAGLAHAWLGR